MFCLSMKNYICLLPVGCYFVVSTVSLRLSYCLFVILTLFTLRTGNITLFFPFLFFLVHFGEGNFKLGIPLKFLDIVKELRIENEVSQLAYTVRPLLT